MICGNTSTCFNVVVASIVVAAGVSVALSSFDDLTARVVAVVIPQVVVAAVVLASVDDVTSRVVVVVAAAVVVAAVVSVF